MIKILLSNDDGFIAPGVNLLRDALSEIADVLTVTPDRDRSASSNSLTLDRPLRLTERGDNFYSSSGTPTDCVHLALTGLYDNGEPDLVISGINAGPNMGDDVIYSGTVAAAMEGRNLGLPAIAVSMTSFNPEHYASGVQAVLCLLEDLPNLQFVKDDSVATILNVNVPDLPWEQIKGFKATRLGKRHAAEPIIKDQDPRGKDIYWVGPPGEAADAGEGTDFFATQDKYVSVTPIHIDLTRYSALDATKDWLSNSQLNQVKVSKSGGVLKISNLNNLDIQGIGMTSQRTRDRLMERLKEKGIKNSEVLRVMSLVPRHLFVDEAMSSRSYEDSSFPIGHGQTISQPYIVARMTELLLESESLDNVLEVGTGSAYQAAVLGGLVKNLHTVEVIPELYRQGRDLLYKLGYRNIRTHLGDGSWGWEVAAPYDAIMVTAAPDEIPSALIEQLKVGGRMIIPVGAQKSEQMLQVLTRSSETNYSVENHESVLFVPLVSSS